MEKKIYVYIHVCCINNWKEIFQTLHNSIKNSGLHEKIQAIRCFLLTTNVNDDASFFYSLNDDKIELLGYHTNLELYEKPTLCLLHERAFHEDMYVLYLHTKGVKHDNKNINVTDWVKYLTYFNIDKNETCIQALKDGADTVGVNLKPKEAINPTHYSGNFWWSKSEYLKKLEPCVYNHYNSTEFWLTERDIGKYHSLWNTDINHYHERYEEDKYKEFVNK